MKNIYITMIVLGLSLGVFGQGRVPLPKHLRDKAVTRKHIVVSPGTKEIQNPYEKAGYGNLSATEWQESVIGTTFYDLQSNSALGNRVWSYPDGTAAAVWTMGFTAENFPDRGTGYNYYNGTTWGSAPTARIETIRAGWPSYAPLGTGEMVVSHDFTAGKLLINTRPAVGAGAWTEASFEGPTGQKISWPRATTNGPNHGNIHILSTTWPVANGGTIYNGQDGALLYSRSTDGGQTWDIMNEVLEGTGANYYNSITADDYVWARPRGNTIAFVCVDTWHDLFVMKSEDSGTSWEKIMVWEHPYPFFDWNTTITTDTIWSPDHSADIAIDADGKVHVVCALTRVAHFEVGTTYSYWPWTDGIAYWNEDMPAFTAPDQHDALDAEDVLVEDVNLIGWTQDVDGNGTIDLLTELFTYRELGISTLPQIAINQNNDIVVVFASSTEGFDNGTNNYKHIWMRTSFSFWNKTVNKINTEWDDEFFDLTSDLVHIFDECMYPVMDFHGNHLRLIYQTDATPGVGVDANHPYQENKIYGTCEDIPVGIGDLQNLPEKLTVSQNMPNPFSKNSVIWAELSQKSGLRLEVSDLLGTRILTLDKGMVNPGKHKFDLNAERFEPGIYFYTVTAGGQSITKKMIIE